MSQDVKTYVIGETTYEQRELTYLQIRQLLALLQGVDFAQDLNYQALLAGLGDKLMPALAIVLSESGQPLRSKDLAALAATLEETMSGTMVERVIADFFALTPVTRLLKSVTGGLQALLSFRSGFANWATESSTSSSSSARETSPDATP